eukprot:172981-Alexandrium_andersonii.AAC.1
MGAGAVSTRGRMPTSSSSWRRGALAGTEKGQGAGREASAWLAPWPRSGLALALMRFPNTTIRSSSE